MGFLQQQTQTAQKTASSSGGFLQQSGQTLAPSKSTAKPISKPTPTITPKQNLVIQIKSKPTIGKVLNIAKIAKNIKPKEIADEAKKMAIETAKDIGYALVSPLKDVPVQFNKDYKKELKTIKTSKDYKKAEAEAKIARKKKDYQKEYELQQKMQKMTDISGKYGGLTPEQSKRAQRGSEFAMTFTKPGGAIPESGAVKGNVGFILRQSKNSVTNKIVNILPKGKVESQDVVNAVFKEGVENTKEGKAIVKGALDARKEGKTIEVVSAEELGFKEAKPSVDNAGIADIKPKTVSVPREQLPVASKEGVERVSRLEARVTESLDKTSQEIKDQLGSIYTQMNKKEQISKASRYVNDNPDDAMAVLRGQKEAPKDILKNSIYVAMENQAKGDVELARKLASLQSTRAGQELSILTEIDPSSPVKVMRDLVKVREEVFKKKYGDKSVKEVSDKVVADIKKKVKVSDKYDWDNFISSLPTC